MITVKFQSRLFEYTGSGSIWYLGGGDFDGNSCDYNWWTNLLFVNNFARTGEPVGSHLRSAHTSA